MNSGIVGQGAITAALVLGAALVAPVAAEIGCAPEASSCQATAKRLSELETAIVTADYRGDLEALATLRDEAGALGDDADLGYLARYWSGFASWRSAINGVNRGLDAAALKAHLERAAEAFEASIAARADFAEAFAASGGVHGWLARFQRDDCSKLLSSSALYFMRTRRALALAPDNPRVLWTDASIDLFLPPQIGGDRDRALRTYRRMLELTEAPAPAGPLPDWGRPEAYMSLAFAHANQTPPDLDAALAEAREALRLRPDWSYVRDVLLPQIEAASKTSSGD